MRKRLFSTAFICCLAVATYIACGDGANGPDSTLEFKEFTTNSPTTFFELLGINLTNLQSYFFVDWTHEVDFDSGTTSPIIRTFARAFAQGQSADNFVFRGVDMGSVSFFQMSADTVRNFIQLGKVSSPLVGFDYRSTASQAAFFSTPTGFRFVPSDRYRFTRLGTSSIDSLSIDLSVPSDSLSFSSPASNSTVSASQDLRIKWQGGLTNERVLVLLQPVFEFSNGRGFLSGIAEFLESNPGEFVLTASSLQAFLEHAQEEVSGERAGSSLTGIFVYVALPTITEVVRDGDRAIVMAFTSDQLFLPLASSE